MTDKTIKFSTTGAERSEEIRETVRLVYNALRDGGYDPINQLVGYIVTEDPTYITSHNNARSLIRKIGRDELVQELIKSYIRKD